MKNIYLIIVTIILLGSCAPKIDVSWTKEGYTTREYKKVAIFAITKNLTVRQNFEKRLADLFIENGIDAVQSLVYVRPGMTKGDIVVEELKDAMLADGVDAVITTFVVDKEKSVNFNPGTGYAMPYGYWGGYYGHAWGMAYDPGYYSESTTFLVENNFFELIPGESREESLLWASQSSITDPGNPVTATKQYVVVLMRAMLADGLIKKQN